MKTIVCDSPVMPTGEYVGQVVQIEAVESNFGPQYRWKFSIVKPEEFNDKTLFGWTSNSGNIKGKFVKWATACMCRVIQPGEQIDSDNLIGSQVLLVVVAKEKEDGGEFNKIEAVRACKKNKPSPAPQIDGDFDPFGA